jgi:hypothetical protein
MRIAPSKPRRSGTGSPVRLVGDGLRVASGGPQTRERGLGGQRAGNTPSCTTGKNRGAPTGESAAVEPFRAIRRNQRHAPRLARNEGVRGSSPRVGSGVSASRWATGHTSGPRTDVLPLHPPTRSRGCMRRRISGAGPDTRPDAWGVAGTSETVRGRGTISSSGGAVASNPRMFAGVLTAHRGATSGGAVPGTRPSLFRRHVGGETERRGAIPRRGPRRRRRDTDLAGRLARRELHRRP